MTIKPGDKLPEITFRVVTQDAPAPKTTSEIFAGRKVVLFAVPGAFTPTCHRNHLPGFLEHYDEFRAKGIDTVAVTAVNDVFVMQAWARAAGSWDDRPKRLVFATYKDALEGGLDAPWEDMEGRKAAWRLKNASSGAPV